MFEFKKQSVLPGFSVSIGVVFLYTALIVLLPLSAVVLKAATMGWQSFWNAVLDPRALASYRLSFGLSFLAALLNAVFGTIIAYVLVRYDFPGRRIFDALVDIPFALPTAVSGIALTAVYAPTGIMGRIFEGWGIQTAYSPIGVFIALVFIGLPFVVRAIQPVLADSDRDVEEAAASLGAGRFHILRRIVFPEILPALLLGTSLAFARAAGEYGSVVFISGNMPFKTEIAPLLIITKLEQYDYAGATAIAVVMLVVSFLVLIGVNILQAWGRRRK